MWISPLAVLWGITKVNCSFTGTGEVTPATPTPPSLPPPFPLPPQFLQTLPSLSPHHSIAQMHPATDGLTWELCVWPPPPCLAVQGQSRYSACKPTARRLSYIDTGNTGNMCLHVVRHVLGGLEWWEGDCLIMLTLALHPHCLESYRLHHCMGEK